MKAEEVNIQKKKIMQMDDEDWDESKEMGANLNIDRDLSSDENDSFDSNGEVSAEQQVRNDTRKTVKILGQQIFLGKQSNPALIKKWKEQFIPLIK